MDARGWSLTLAAAALCCAPGDRDLEPKLIQEGRTYTTWLYESQYDKLWNRFSPEMRQTFGSVGDLASFAGRAVKNLGTEEGKPVEQLNDAAPYKVYSRTASFNRSPRRMRIEWSLAQDGAVTGLVVRPEADSVNQ